MTELRPDGPRTVGFLHMAQVHVATFEALSREDYRLRIAKAAFALSNRCDVVVLAQASRNPPPCCPGS
ncbi:hypothetical protein [Pseudarthrobacter sp. NPDC058119]|uniref:hypothetical protein n=1 Tax=Pseudarthrobacter sp. NPDC058119 TaxID=3346348 RepID=UPI0036DA00E7